MAMAGTLPAGSAAAIPTDRPIAGVTPRNVRTSAAWVRVRLMEERMRSTRYLGVAVCASLLFAATACGDDDDVDSDAAATTTTVADGPTAIEVTLTADGFEGMPTELPAGLVEITLVNETGDFASLDITRVAAGTTEDEFVEGLAPLFEGGPFPEFFESNVGVGAGDGETETSTVVLREGEHIVWFEAPTEDEEAEDDGEDAETETETVTETETEPTTETTVAEDDDADDATTTTAVEETTTSTTAAEGEEQGAASGQPTGTLTAVAAEDDADDTETETETETDSDTDTDSDDGDDQGGEPSVMTATLEVTAGDASAELPEADGEIVATDYQFDATLDGPGTINFRNDGPEQFHHAVVMDFGTNDPDAVEEAFPAILESEGDPSAIPGTSDIDMDQVNFDFGGSGVFGPDGASGTFEADIVEGNTYVLVCFIQDRTGGPPHAIAYDMWDVVQAGGGGDDTTTTTDG